MITHTHYLNVIVILATSYPVVIPQILLPFSKQYDQKGINNRYIVGCALSCFFLLSMVYVIIPINPIINWTNNIVWFMIPLILAPMMIAMEYIINAVILKISNVKITGISVNNNWKNMSISAILATLFIAVFEELIFRSLWSEILIVNLGFSIFVYVILNSLFYGINHLYFGIITFIQKMITGIVFSGLYILSGGQIIVPIITHVLQNIIVLLIGRGNKKC